MASRRFRGLGSTYFHHENAFLAGESVLFFWFAPGTPALAQAAVAAINASGLSVLNYSYGATHYYVTARNNSGRTVALASITFPGAVPEIAVDDHDGSELTRAVAAAVNSPGTDSSFPASAPAAVTDDEGATVLKVVVIGSIVAMVGTAIVLGVVLK